MWCRRTGAARAAHLVEEAPDFLACKGGVPAKVRFEHPQLARESVPAQRMPEMGAVSPSKVSNSDKSELGRPVTTTEEENRDQGSGM